MRTKIAKLHEAIGSITICVTHDQTEATTLASRIVVMNEGIIQQIGTSFEVYNAPNIVFIAGFISFPSMNFDNVIYNNGRLSNESGLDIPVNGSNKRTLDGAGYDGK